MGNTTVDTVKDLVVETLGIQDRAHQLTEETGLFASMPEFDSLALVEIITLVEERFGFEIDEADITAETFATVGSLSAYIDSQQSNVA